MSDPLVPNYKPGVGRLATDRFDFEKHINGEDFKHDAGIIELFPVVVIGSEIVDNVQDAITQLALSTVPPSVPDATTTSKGIIQITGDISGFSNNIVVVGLQGKPVSSLLPNDGDVLTWDSGSSTWSPQSSANSFVASGDLTGTNIVQQVVSLTGSSGTVVITCNSLGFTSNVTPSLFQNSTSTADGANFSVLAQNATGTNRNGGSVILQGGSHGSGGLSGGVQVKINGGSTMMVQATEVAANRRVLSLLHGSTLSTLDMPSNTGDKVIYIRDAATTPTNSPSNGTIVYSTGGQLWIKQQDGNSFQVGSLTNPVIWGDTGQQVYRERVTVDSSPSIPTAAISFALPDNASTFVRATLVGKQSGSVNSGQFAINMGYVRHSGGLPVAIGGITIEVERDSGTANLWNNPTIATSGNTVQIFTGSAVSDTITWLVVVELFVSQA